MDEPRILIACFSRRGSNYLDGRIVDLPVGHTEMVALKLQELTGGELFRIEPAHAYPKDYHATTEAARRERDRDERPALAALPEGLEGCSTVLLGYPNWWNTMPMPVFTFLESQDFRGKTILPFCTHEGSGLGASERDIRRLCPGATVLPGLALRGGRAEECRPELEAWLQRSGISRIAPAGRQ